MLIGITARLRNGLLLRYRLDNKLNQRQAAELAGVHGTCWNSVEVLRFKDTSYGVVKRIADCIGCEVEDIYPEELRDQNLPMTRAMFRRVEAEQLAAKPIAFLPADINENDDGDEERRRLVAEVLDTLTYREREILKLRFGLGEGGHTYTWEEIARIFKVTRERVRQVVLKAIRKMQEPEHEAKLRSLLG
jgi:RNA polymerase sigma factor (sigma-70 family)